MDKHRYFIFGEDRNIWVPPCTNNSGNCWVHHANGSIEREHLIRNDTSGLQEVTEEEARRLDPEMFRSTVDRPFQTCDTTYPTYKAFYDHKYEQESGQK